MSNPTVTIVGRIGQDPEAIGSNGLRLRVATNDRVKNDSTGEWEDKNTSWWTVKAWKSLAEQSKLTLKKGMEVTITGKIYEETWTDKETGKNRHKIKFVVQKFWYIDEKTNADEELKISSQEEFSTEWL